MTELSRFLDRRAALALAAGAALLPATAFAQGNKMTTTDSGLQIIDTVVGTGDQPKPGQICVMHYTGWLYENGTKGKKFDSSHDRNKPFTFLLGGGDVIKGWDQGVVGMKVGGKRRLTIPHHLAYGRRGYADLIPPRAALIFEVELLAVR